jgi:hypothetical protein
LRESCEDIVANRGCQNCFEQGFLLLLGRAVKGIENSLKMSLIPNVDEVLAP